VSYLLTLLRKNWPVSVRFRTSVSRNNVEPRARFESFNFFFEIKEFCEPSAQGFEIFRAKGVDFSRFGTGIAE
jgi:hypothetical protein